MNRGVKYSLLDCKGRYTVRIATFTGRVVIDQRQIQSLERDKNSPLLAKGEQESPLAEAAMKAHALTEALRGKNVEAYEFHDSHTSLVTVGSFDSVGMPRADGKIEINPKIYEILKTYGADQSALASGQAIEGLKQKTVICNVDGVKRPLPLDLQPMPVEVPKRTLSSDYRQTVLCALISSSLGRIRPSRPLVFLSQLEFRVPLALPVFFVADRSRQEFQRSLAEPVAHNPRNKR